MPTDFPGHLSGGLPGLSTRLRHRREWLIACALALAGHALLLAGLDGARSELGASTRADASPDLAQVRPLLLVRPVVPDPPAAAPGERGARADVAEREVGEVSEVRDVRDVRDVREVRTGADAARVPPAGRDGDRAGLAGPPQPDTAAPSVPAAARVPAPSSTVAGTGTEAPPPAAMGQPSGPGTSTQTRAPSTSGDTAREEAADAAASLPYAGAPPPLWTTRLPGDFAVAYALRRGADAPRVATLRWELQDGRYTLQLQGGVAGRGPEQASQGRVEPHGLAPERYIDRRRARAAVAANFDRAGGRITYSGGSGVQPHFAGAQDRLSWIVQLAAVLEADPQRARDGAVLPLYVSGARGDAQLWAFVVRGQVAPEGPVAGAQALLHLVREPERPYDLRVEAWLDPARQHLPARLRLTPVPAGQPLEWVRLP